MCVSKYYVQMKVLSWSRTTRVGMALGYWIKTAQFRNLQEKWTICTVPYLYMFVFITRCIWRSWPSLRLLDARHSRKLCALLLPMSFFRSSQPTTTALLRRIEPPPSSESKLEAERTPERAKLFMVLRLSETSTSSVALKGSASLEFDVWRPVVPFCSRYRLFHW